MILHRLTLTAALCALFAVAHAQITRTWVATHNGEGDRNDRFTCVVKNTAGEFYLGGSVTNSDQDRDYLLVKADVNGTLIWRREFNGEGSGADEVTAIALDGAGNLLATGFSKSLTNGTDYRTVKLDPAGTLLWSAVYNNPVANGYDQPNAVAVDGAGNVIVTGQSDGDPGSAQSDDYATLKYDPAGTELWVVRYDGIGQATDRATGLVVDGGGDVYVTGRTDNGGNDDYGTIRYSSAGVQQWVVFGDRGGRDRAVAMVLGSAGDLYVTGRSDNGNNDDLWTVKYNNAGVQQWQTPYDFVEDDRAIAMVIDASDNVYVTGQSDGNATPVTNWDMVCAKYSSSGAQQWAQRFNGTASNDDLPVGIATDGSRVYIVGVTDADASANVQNDGITRCYDAATGTLQWSTPRASAGGLDDDERPVVALTDGCLSAGNNSMAAADRNAVADRYSSTGTQQWELSVDGIGDNNDNIRAIAVDGTGNVYGAGYMVESRQNRDFSLWKVNSTGATVCTRTLGGTSPSSPDEAQTIALTTTGDPVLAGFTKNSGESNNITCARANVATCDTAWTRMLLTAANGSDKVYDMVSDGSGNFILTGRIDNDPSYAADDDLWTAKMNAAGTFLWSVSYNSGGGHEDRGSLVRVGALGNIYVTGRTWNGTDYDVLTIKYNAGGAQQWVQTWASGNGDDQPAGLALDAAENVWVGASAATAGDTTFDVLTLKYNSNGAVQWAQTFNGGGDDRSAGLVVNATGNVFIAATSDGDPSPAQDLQVLVASYDNAGTQLWSVLQGGAADDHADDLALNPGGQICVAAHTNSSTVADPNYDATLLVLDPLGAVLMTDTYNATGDTSDVPARILITGGNTYIGGYSATAASMRDQMIIKYVGDYVGITDLTIEHAQVFPTLFTDHLTVVTDAGPAWLELNDAAGRVVLRTAIGFGRNELEMPAIAPGVLSYRIQLPHGTSQRGVLVHLNP